MCKYDLHMGNYFFYNYSYDGREKNYSKKQKGYFAQSGQFGFSNICWSQEIHISVNQVICPILFFFRFIVQNDVKIADKFLNNSVNMTEVEDEGYDFSYVRYFLSENKVIVINLNHLPSKGRKWPKPPILGKANFLCVWSSWKF